jgi:hypothetical protein
MDHKTTTDATMFTAAEAEFKSGLAGDWRARFLLRLITLAPGGLFCYKHR